MIAVTSKDDDTSSPEDGKVGSWSNCDCLSESQASLHLKLRVHNNL